MSLPRLAILASVAVPLLQGQAAATPLLPHRAVYDLALDQATESSGITGLSGRMVYQFEGSACEGYTVSFRFVTEISANETSRLTDQQTTTFEAGDGSEFSFETRSFIEQNLDKEIRGFAERTDDAIEAFLEMSEPRQYSLERSQFPTQHLLEVIEKANAGENFYETTIYDGSEEGDKVMTTTVVLGRKTDLAEDDAERPALGELASQQFWPVDIAYFDLSDVSGEETPTYRIAMKLYENGVTRDLTMDYGDFVISGQLVDLELFERPADCPQ